MLLTFDDVLIRPQKSIVSSRSEVDVASYLTSGGSIVDIPILSSNMNSVTNVDTLLKLRSYGANGVLSRFKSDEDRIAESKAVKDVYSRDVMAAVGLKDGVEFLLDLSRYAGIFVLDVANAYSEDAFFFYRHILSEIPVQVIVGNIATYEAAKEWVSLGVDGLKVGIGPGAACSTRTQTGVGVPQLEAISECYRATRGDITIIADGGIRSPGDACKAFIAGADTVMLGRELAFTCDNTASDTDSAFGAPYKVYYGNASLMNRPDSKYAEGEVVEGGLGIKHPSLKEKIDSYAAGIRSMVSYTGGKRLVDVVGRQELLIPVSSSVVRENSVRRD